jgi:hypothetical protein
MKILVLGVFNTSSIQNWICTNVFPEIFKNSDIQIVNLDTFEINMKNIDLVILSGGEISEKTINDLIGFENFFKLEVPKIALGVGITDLDSIQYLDYFNHIYYRNKTSINTLLSNQYYLPDLAFSLPKNLIFSNLVNSKNNLKQKIGVYLNFLESDEILSITHILNLLSIDFEVTIYNCNNKNLEYLEINSKNINFKLDMDNNKLLYEIGQNDYAICMRYYSFILCTIMRVPFIGICKNNKTNLYMKEQCLDKYSISNLSELNNKFTELTNDPDIANKLEEIYLRNSEIFESIKNENWVSEYMKTIYYLFSLSDNMNYTYNLIKYLGFKIYKQKDGYKLKLDRNNNVTTTLKNCTKIILNNCKLENLNIFDLNIDEWIGVIQNKNYLRNIFNDINIDMFQKCTGIYVLDKELYNLCSNYLYMKDLEVEIEIIKNLDEFSILNSKIYKLI